MVNLLPEKITQVEEAIRSYMRQRIASGKILEVTPTFEMILQSGPVSRETEELEEKSHYVREAIRRLFDEGYLVIRRLPEMHVHRGMNGMEKMLRQEEFCSEIHVASRAGYGTIEDSLLIHQEYMKAVEEGDI